MRSDIELVDKAVNLGFRDQDSCAAWERLKNNLQFLPVNLIDRLAELYKTDSFSVAKVCDEVLDRSGALLGKVRVRSSELRAFRK